MNETSIIIHTDPRRPFLSRVLLNGHEVYVTGWTIEQGKPTAPGTVTLRFMPDRLEVIPVPRPDK